jgi:hypothetical protein
MNRVHFLPELANYSGQIISENSWEGYEKKTLTQRAGKVLKFNFGTGTLEIRLVDPTDFCPIRIPIFSPIQIRIRIPRSIFRN